MLAFEVLEGLKVCERAQATRSTSNRVVENYCITGVHPKIQLPKFGRIVLVTSG